MDEKRKQGYVSGIICLLSFFILLIFALRNEFNLSGQILWVFTIFFGGLGIGSIWKPDIIGEIASELLKNMSKNGVETKSDSHNKQVQMQSPHGVQAMATQGGNVTINVDPEKKEHESTFRECKRVIRKSSGLLKGHLKHIMEEGDKYESKDRTQGEIDNIINELSTLSLIGNYDDKVKIKLLLDEGRDYSEITTTDQFIAREREITRWVNRAIAIDISTE